MTGISSGSIPFGSVVACPKESPTRISRGEQGRSAGVGLPFKLDLIDLSEQADEIWEAVREWLRSEKPVDLLTYGGNGALLWVWEGRVVGYVAYAGRHSDDELMKSTGDAFHDR